MNVWPIKTEVDYQTALKEIESLFEAIPNTPEGDRLEVLTTLVEAYEERRYSLPLPDPVEAILYHMESRGLTRRDLEPRIGNRARVSEILNRKRPLTLRMIQRLHNELGIPAEVLLGPYRIPKRQRVRKTLPPNKSLQRTAASPPKGTRSAPSRRIGYQASRRLRRRCR